MKKLLLRTAAAFLILLTTSLQTTAQNLCTNDMGALAPTITNTWNTLATTGGYYQFNAVAGCDYTFTYCQNGGSTPDDSYITITDLSNTVIITNDDVCGLGSELIWNCSTSGTYLLHLTTYGAGIGACNLSPSVLAYYSSCSACAGVPPADPIISPDFSICGAGQVTISADQNGATNVETIWFQSGIVNAIDTTFTATASQVITISGTTTFTVINHDLISGCNSNAAMVVVTVTPLPFVNIGSLGDIYCVTASPANLTLTPVGGTLSGTGISGNTFDPASAGLGSFAINYSYTDGVTGCSNTDVVNVVVEDITVDPAVQICDGSSVDLNGTGLTSYEWYDESIGGNLIGTGQLITVSNILSDTVFYYQEIPSPFGFGVDTLTSGSAINVEHDALTGDDHGGMAITPDYIYYVGDNSAVRYDFPSLTNPIAVAQRDGIFSDLETGQLFSLWDGIADPVGTTITTGGYTISHIVSLNNDLTLGATIIPLSQTITTGGNYGGPQSGIFSGYGFMIFHNNDDNNFYRIDVNTGAVTIEGNVAFPVDADGTENWSRWGVAEYMNGLYSVVYSTGGNLNSIDRIYCSSGTVETVSQFTSLGDVASIAYSPWHNKWAYHTEVQTDHTPAYGEYIVVLDGSHILNYPSERCRKELPVVFYTPAVDAGANTAILAGGSVQLTGTGGVTCSWSPATGLDNANSCTPMASPAATQEYFLTITDANGCQATDSVTVFLSSVSLDEYTMENAVSVYPNPSRGDITVDLSTVAKGSAITIEVIDALGKIVKVIEATDKQQIILKRNELSTGIYTLQFNVENTLFTKRIVFED